MQNEEAADNNKSAEGVISDFKGIKPVAESEVEIPPESREEAEDGYLNNWTEEVRRWMAEVREAEKKAKDDQFRRNLGYMLILAVLVLASFETYSSWYCLMHDQFFFAATLAGTATATVLYAFRCVIHYYYQIPSNHKEEQREYKT